MFKNKIMTKAEDVGTSWDKIPFKKHTQPKVKLKAEFDECMLYRLVIIQINFNFQFKLVC